MWSVGCIIINWLLILDAQLVPFMNAAQVFDLLWAMAMHWPDICLVNNGFGLNECLFLYLMLCGKGLA
jgi:hypothetical protein